MATCVAETRSRYTVLVIYFYTPTCVCWFFFSNLHRGVKMWKSVSNLDQVKNSRLQTPEDLPLCQGCLRHTKVHGPLSLEVVAIRKFSVVNLKQPPPVPFKTETCTLVSSCKEQGVRTG